MAKPNSDRVIAIPREIIPHSNSRALGGVLTTWLMFYGGIALSAVAMWFAPTWLAILLTMLAMVIGGYGMLNMGFMGHDGFHFSLHTNKLMSSWMGVIAGAPIAFPVTGFAVSHWNHHKHTNGVDDPDVQIFGKFKTFLSRVVLARPYAYAIYYRNAFSLAVGNPLPYPYSFPLPYKEMRRPGLSYSLRVSSNPDRCLGRAQS